MRIGIVGAGMIGSTLAKLWVDAGHDVRMASRHPEELQPVVERLGRRASAGAPQDAATFGEVVLLTVPLKAVPDLVRDLAPLLEGSAALCDRWCRPVTPRSIARVITQNVSVRVSVSPLFDGTLIKKVDGYLRPFGLRGHQAFRSHSVTSSVGWK